MDAFEDCQEKNPDNVHNFSIGTGGAVWHVINQSNLNNKVLTLMVAAYDLIHEHGAESSGGLEAENCWAESDRTPHISHFLRCGGSKPGHLLFQRD